MHKHAHTHAKARVCVPTRLRSQPGHGATTQNHHHTVFHASQEASHGSQHNATHHPKSNTSPLTQTTNPTATEGSHKELSCQERLQPAAAAAGTCPPQAAYSLRAGSKAATYMTTGLRPARDDATA